MFRKRAIVTFFLQNDQFLKKTKLTQIWERHSCHFESTKKVSLFPESRLHPSPPTSPHLRQKKECVLSLLLPLLLIQIRHFQTSVGGGGGGGGERSGDFCELGAKWREDKKRESRMNEWGIDWLHSLKKKNCPSFSQMWPGGFQLCRFHHHSILPAPPPLRKRSKTAAGWPPSLPPLNRRCAIKEEDMGKEKVTSEKRRRRGKRRPQKRRVFPD